ncbi:MAG: prepilin-type N-terminal cleavage/methylation domain-containing protein [Chthoniobacter sp.]|uniref:type II secretion system protein n=1 Tax=Chthoniobacter sp. TaxID=2510640 RepID=UPI0032A6D254
MLRRRLIQFAAFTLMELMTVIVIVGILATMVFGAMADLQYRADRANCVANLKTLYTGAAIYIQQQGSWPQVDPQHLAGGSTQYAQEWIDALQPCGVARTNWVCPSVQRLLHNPDVTLSSNVRVDYIATPFDSKPMTPYLWPKQPWFAESASVHGDGNMMIWGNGQTVSLKEALSYQ